jgi:hypothetical protein
MGEKVQFIITVRRVLIIYTPLFYLPTAKNATDHSVLPLPFLFFPRRHREPTRGREERQQEDVTERWWATNPNENVSSSVFMVLCSREESMI